jgi:sugar lactone lactonase YvrE
LCLAVGGVAVACGGEGRPLQNAATATASTAPSSSPSAPQVIVHGEANPGEIAVDASGLYWLTAGTPAKSFKDGTVRRADKDGGHVMSLSDGHSSPWSLTLDGDNVYFGSHGSSEDPRHLTGMKVSAVGKAKPGSGKTLSKAEQPTGLAVDPQKLYWLNSTGGNSTLESVALDGGAAGLVANVPSSATPTKLAADDKNLYINVKVSGDAKPASLSDAWAAKIHGITRVSKAGGAPEVLAEADGPIEAMVLRSGQLYYIEQDKGTPSSPTCKLKKLAATGGTPTVLASSIARPGRAITMTADDAFVYWPDAGGPNRDATGSVWRVPVGGGAASPVASNQPRPFSVALDDTTIYWVTETEDPNNKYLLSGDIVRVAKPR